MYKISGLKDPVKDHTILSKKGVDLVQWESVLYCASVWHRDVKYRTANQGMMILKQC